MYRVYIRHNFVTALFFWSELKLLAIYGAGQECLEVFTPSNSPIAAAQYKNDLGAVICVLIIKHSKEKMVNDNANLVNREDEKTAQKGLKIEVVGNHVATTMDEFRRLLNENVKKKTSKDDTLVVNTVCN